MSALPSPSTRPQKRHGLHFELIIAQDLVYTKPVNSAKRHELQVPCSQQNAVHTIMTASSAARDNSHVQPSTFQGVCMLCVGTFWEGASHAACCQPLKHDPSTWVCAAWGAASAPRPLGVSALLGGCPAVATIMATCLAVMLHVLSLSFVTQSLGQHGGRIGAVGAAGPWVCLSCSSYPAPSWHYPYYLIIQYHTHLSHAMCQCRPTKLKGLHGAPSSSSTRCGGVNHSPSKSSPFPRGCMLCV
jgi:hypothetical protein